MNSVCTVEVSLGATGLDPLIWTLAVAALLALVLGAALALARRARARRALVVLAVLGVVCLGALGPQAASPAQAAASDVSSSDGCTLIQLDEADVVFEPVASQSLLSGDSVTAITAVVDNAFAGPIELSGNAVLGSGPLAALLHTEVLFDGVPGPVTLAEGGSTTVTVVVTLPLSADDSAQSETVTVDLVLTASQA